MIKTTIARRQFLAWGSVGFSAFLVNGSRTPLLAAEASTLPLFTNSAALGELREPDANGLRLLPGMRSRVIARTGQKVVGTSDYLWHKSPDGGATFDAPDGGWIYVSNSEVETIDGGGGVGAIRFDAEGKVVNAYSILINTNNNCAGGKTPWQTWLSCEEVDQGLVWECDPFGEKPGVARPALGLFKHEAVAVDLLQGHLYLTEDEAEGCLYRFIPANGLPDLTAGKLQVAELTSERKLVWHDLPDPSAATVPTREQVEESATFNGGEGIGWFDGNVYFTTKGDNRVWRLDTRTQQLEVLYDFMSVSTPHLRGVDNVTITASGDVLVAEDGGDMQIVLLGPDGLVLPVVQVTGQPKSEICGPAFDPSFQRLYFSSQTGPDDTPEGGIIYEISF